MSLEICCDICRTSSADLKGYGKFTRIEGQKFIGVSEVGDKILRIDICDNCLNDLKTHIEEKRR